MYSLERKMHVTFIKPTDLPMYMVTDLTQHAVRKDLSFHQLAIMTKKPFVKNKDLAIGIIGAEFKEGSIKRCKANVKNITALLLDYDGGLTIEEFENNNKNFQWILYTSSGHLIKNGKERFRVVIPLVEPVSTEEVTLRKRELTSFFDVDDDCSFSGSQVFRMPIVEEEAHLEHYEHIVNDGQVFNFRLMFSTTEKQAKATIQALEEKRLKSEQAAAQKWAHKELDYGSIASLVCAKYTNCNYMERRFICATLLNIGMAEGTVSIVHDMISTIDAQQSFAKVIAGRDQRYGYTKLTKICGCPPPVLA
jgi:hypothetical protein